LPFVSAEKRSGRGVWKRPHVRGAYRAPSSGASPRPRASQGTPKGRDAGVCFLLLTFLCTSKEK
ncbi:MAG: hypothetical protein EPO48_04225, partial [Nevskiaceae bacterium]